MNFTAGQVDHILSVGAPAFVELASVHGSSKRIKTKFRGWEPDEYVMLDLPALAEEAAAVVKDTPCIVRFVHEGAAYGFDTTILDRCGVGFAFFRVAWPKTLQMHRVRQHARMPVSIPCSVVWSDQEETGDIRDLSLGGCGILMPRLIRHNTPLRLSFTLPDGAPLAHVPASVSSTRTLRNSVWIGCHFADDPEGDRDPLIFYMTSTLSRMGLQPMADRRALVLHNERTDLRPLVKTLEDAGVQVITAHGIVDGFYRLRMAPPGCIFVDVDQPIVSVQEICAAIQHTPGFEKTPLFLLGDCPDGAALRAECHARGHFPAADVEHKAEEILTTCVQSMQGRSKD